MEASEVLKLYAQGHRNFRRENLRGQNFKGKDLSGADFSEAEIQGANFTNTNLTNAKFIKAKAGLTKPQLIGWFFALPIFVAIALLLSGFTAYFPRELLTNDDFAYRIAGWISLSILGIMWLVILCRGLISGLKMTLAGGVIAMAIAAAAAMVATKVIAIAAVYTGIIAIIAAGAISASTALAAVISFNQAPASLEVLIILFIVAYAETVFLAGPMSVLVSWLNIYIAWRAIKGSPRDGWLRSVAIACAGGTSFRNANLTDADFTAATLQNTDFRKAVLTRSLFRETQIPYGLYLEILKS